VSPDGTRVYVTGCTNDGKLTVVDTADPTADPAYLDAVASPCSVAIAPDGRRAYVAGLGDPQLLTAQDLTAPAAAGPELALDSPTRGVFLSPDGQQLYLAHWEENLVSIVDPARLQVRTTFPVQRPRAVAVSPDSTLAYISSEETDQVLVVDARDPARSPPRTIPITDPGAIALSADGTRAVVCNVDDTTLTVVDTTTLTAIGNPIGVGTLLSIGNIAADVAVTPDGRFAYVAQLGGDSSSIVVVELPDG
jgi:YVTN family beta-propeller protein